MSLFLNEEKYFILFYLNIPNEKYNIPSGAFNCVCGAW